MRLVHWLVEELKSLASVALYFGACFAAIIVLKTLVLAEYGIVFSGFPVVVLLALVTSKVVIVLDKVRLDRWLGGAPALVDVIVRTVLYTAVALVLLMLERAFDARAEHGGFAASLSNILEHRDMPQVYATTLCVGLAFAAYNVFTVVRREVGTARLTQIFLSVRRH